MSAGVPQRLWDVNDLVALWEAYEQRRAERAAHMNRTFEVVSGIGVLLLSLQGSAVIFQCIFYSQSSVRLSHFALYFWSNRAVVLLRGIYSAFVGQKTKVAHYRQQVLS
jgi:hypothetical protein